MAKNGVWAACTSLAHAEANLGDARYILFWLGKNNLTHDVIYVTHVVIYITHDVIYLTHDVG